MRPSRDQQEPEWLADVPAGRLRSPAPAPPARWQGVLGAVVCIVLVVLLCILASGCSHASKRIQDAHTASLLRWSQAVHALLCQRYPERDSRALCSQEPEGALESVRVRWESLCLPAPPEGLADVCGWIREDLAILSQEVPGAD